jgi:hypothetical protein
MGQVFIYTLLLPETHMGEAWKNYKNPCRFGHRRALDRKVASLSIFNGFTAILAWLVPEPNLCREQHLTWVMAFMVQPHLRLFIL